MKTITRLTIALLVFAGCRANDEPSPERTTDNPRYNEDVRTPEDNTRTDQVDSTYRNRGNDTGSFL